MNDNRTADFDNFVFQNQVTRICNEPGTFDKFYNVSQVLCYFNDFCHIMKFF